MWHVAVRNLLPVTTDYMAWHFLGTMYIVSGILTLSDNLHLAQQNYVPLLVSRPRESITTLWTCQPIHTVIILYFVDRASRNDSW